MKVEDIFEIVTWGQVTFDPLRPRLYFSESRADKRTNKMHHRLMMIKTDADLANATPTALTNGPSDVHPTPSPDGRWLAFLSRRSGSAQLWCLPLEGGEPTQVTLIKGGLKTFTWLPDSQSFVVVAHIENGLLEREAALEEPTKTATDEQLFDYYNRDVKHITHQYYKLDGEGFFDKGRDQLVWVALTGNTELLSSGTDHYSDPVFSPDGQSLFCLYRAYDPEGDHPAITRVKRLDWQTRSWSTIALPDWSIDGLALSADGRHLAFCASKPDELGYGLTTLYRYDLTHATLTDLSSHTDRSVGDESSSDVPASTTARPVWREDTVLMLLSDEGRVTLATFANGHVTKLWDDRRVVYDFAVRGDEVALALSDPTHPSGIMLVRMGEAQGEIVFAPTPWQSAKEGDQVSSEPVAPTELWATESDGTKVHTWCLRPEGEGPFPVVLEIHGGPMAMYGYRYFHEFQCLVQAGYAVVYTNPRGSQGYGHHFCDAIVGQWGDKDYRDVSTGFEAALGAWPELDGDRAGVAGGSYGGFMVNWMIAHSHRFKAAVTMRSVVNRFSAMGSSDMGWLRVPQYGSKPWWEEPESYWQQSPLRYASNIITPLLIEHQEKDYRLPIEQAEQLYSALKYLGRTVEMILYPDESHGMSRTGKPWHRVYRLHSIIQWFDRYLKAEGSAE